MKVVHVPTGLTGILINQIPATSLKPWITWVIRLDNGREYFAPQNEFKMTI